MAKAAHEASRAEGFEFLLDYEPTMSWARYLQVLEEHRQGKSLPPERVPATFLVAVIGSDIVGRISIRHQLNDYLASVGGHIGYAVLSQFRRRGYATEMLGQGLVIARALGIDRVLVTCDDDNVASAAVIERSGGVLDRLVEQGPGVPPKRRYRID